MEWAKIKDAVVRRPLVVAVVLLILEISAHRVISLGPGLVIGICVGLVMLSFLLQKWNRAADLLLGAAVLGCGVAVAQLEECYFSRGHIANFTTDQRRLARVEIEIVTAPRILGMGDPNRPLAPRQVAQGKVLRILTTRGWEEGSGEILVQLQQPVIWLEIRQKLEGLGMLERPMRAVVYLVCGLLMFSPRKWGWVGMSFVVLYGLVALPSPPVVRSILLCIVFGIGLISRRSLDGVHLVALSAFMMLIIHPLDLYNAGFQLSFGTTLGLMLFAPALLGFFVSLRDRHMEIAYSGQRPRGWAAGKRYLRIKAEEVLGTCFIAALVAAPLTAFHFNQ